MAGAEGDFTGDSNVLFNDFLALAQKLWQVGCGWIDEQFGARAYKLLSCIAWNMRSVIVEKK